ncbi:MAG: hypothetical protein ATN36_06620 [Epulopiscium sp. Nele67-Bin005]|nr:MAG: hypothetical protein ATN36_06620 [Epulopiscium sp. Nele67-Bin005]
MSNNYTPNDYIQDWFEINGKYYDVLVLECEQTANILDTDNSGRTIEFGAMLTDRIGTFYTHRVIFAQKNNEWEVYDELFSALEIPTNTAIRIKFPHHQGTTEYDAYVASLSRKIIRIYPNSTSGQKIKWGELQVNFIAIDANLTVQ